MTFKRDIPPYETSFDDLIEGEQYPHQGERDFSCRVLNGDRVKVADWELTIDDALQFIEFYNANTEGVEGPCGLSKTLEFWSGGGARSYRVPDHILDSVVMWLKHALGVEKYDGPADRWEEL